MRHKKLLLACLLGLFNLINEHREICHQWNYSPELKRILTNTKKALIKCIHKFDFKLDQEDKKIINNKLDDYNRVKARIKINDDDILVNTKAYKDILPKEFLVHISNISVIKNYIEDELQITVDRMIKEEYKKFILWFDKYDKFLETKIFI